MSAASALGRVVQVNVNPRGGVPKRPVPAAELTAQGVAGDMQRDREHHGGPTRAVSLFAQERIAALRAEGHPITPGSAGENLTVAGIDWDAVRVGDTLRVGDWVELEVTGYAAPCSTIAESFIDGEFTRISQKLRPGWSRLYASVVSPGEVRPGDPVELRHR
ncbi:MOSC domain-containing protein [Oscillochloris sp. ZM17-4]|uniref:MOSC domain-containing protein n=1 Tax=Oscillochloris sp. ZM17-4 TaxID=2866714 RepID=UPI001C72F3CD|nr:MOSC domain-containing protein [Oscillochloris sp. ZM17-4]MBX0327459.1 MOSC domain-containing protein [Oscillochloris sp. ZM17-4]